MPAVFGLQLGDHSALIGLLLDQLVLEREVLDSLVELLKDFDCGHGWQGFQAFLLTHPPRLLAVRKHCVLIVDCLDPALG